MVAQQAFLGGPSHQSRQPIKLRFLGQERYGVRTAFVALSPALDSSIAAGVSVDYDAVVELDVCTSETLIRLDPLIADSTAAIADVLQAGKWATPRYRALARDIRDDVRILETLRDAGFQAGTGGALLRQLGIVAGATVAQQEYSNHVLRPVATLYEKLKTTDFKVDRVLRPGELQLRALFTDLAELHRNQGIRLCLHLSSDSSFPRRAFDLFIETARKTGAANAICLVVSGLIDPGSDESWPSERTVVTNADEHSVAVSPVSRRAFTIDWSSASRWLDLLLANLDEPDHARVEPALILGVLGGFVDAGFLHDLLGYDFPTCQRIAVAIGSHSGVSQKLPLKWRRCFIVKLSPTAIGMLRLRAEVPGTLLSTESVVAACAALYVFHRDCYYLDHAVCSVVRKDLKSLASARDQLRLLYGGAFLLTAAERKELRERIDVLNLLLEGECRAVAISSYYEQVCARQADRLPTELLAEAHYQLGYIHYVRRQNGQALSALDAVLGFDSEHYRALNVQGLIALRKKGQWKYACMLFDAAIRINGGYEYSRYNAGVAWERRDEWEIAASHYVACLILEPDFYEALFNLSNVLLNMGCLREAGIVAEIGARCGRWCETEILSNLAIAYVRSGHFEEGQQLLHAAHRENPTDYVKFNIAFCCYLRDKTAEAKSWLDRIHREDLSAEHAKAVAALLLSIESGERAKFVPEPPDQDEMDMGVMEEIERLIAYYVDIGFRREPRIQRYVGWAKAVTPQKNAVSGQPSPGQQRSLVDLRDRDDPPPKTVQQESYGTPSAHKPVNREKQPTPETLARETPEERLKRLMAHREMAPPERHKPKRRGRGVRGLDFIRLPSYSGG